MPATHGSWTHGDPLDEDAEEEFELDDADADAETDEDMLGPPALVELADAVALLPPVPADEDAALALTMVGRPPPPPAPEEVPSLKTSDPVLQETARKIEQSRPMGFDMGRVYHGVAQRVRWRSGGRRCRIRR